MDDALVVEKKVQGGQWRQMLSPWLDKEAAWTFSVVPG